MKRSHWRKSHPGFYKGLMGLNFIQHKHIFWYINRKHVWESRRSKRNGSPFSIPFFFMLLQWAKAITTTTDRLLKSSREDNKLLHAVCLLLLLGWDVSLGILRGFFQALSTGSKTCSSQMLWTCSGKKTCGLQGKHSISLHSCCSSYPATRYYTLRSHTDQN